MQVCSRVHILIYLEYGNSANPKRSLYIVFEITVFSVSFLICNLVLVSSVLHQTYRNGDSDFFKSQSKLVFNVVLLKVQYVHF